MAGVDVTNQFPGSNMARAVKAGHSRFRSTDAATIVVAGEQNNVSIAVAGGLTVPAGATYAVVCAIGGAAYYTYDNTVPSPTNYAGTLSAGQMLPVNGAIALAALRIVGTTMSVSYWR